jgi:hypothetical protein
MVLQQSVTSRADFPPELIRALEDEASRSADNVASFLSEVGVRFNPENPVRFPRKFLLNLAAGLRLDTWESHGCFIHRELGLPAAEEVIRAAVQSLTDLAIGRPDLLEAAVRIFCERFAWNGRSDLNADVVLDDITDDAALEALAAFLWASRHDGQKADEPQR